VLIGLGLAYVTALGVCTDEQFLKDNGLGLVFGLGFLLALAGQALAGHADYNDRQIRHGAETGVLGRIPHLLQLRRRRGRELAIGVPAVLPLRHRRRLAGATRLPRIEEARGHRPESDTDQLIGAHARPGSPRWAKTGGWRTTLYANSLGAVMGLIFLASWAAQSVAGWAAYNAEQLSQRQDPISWAEYLGAAEFWNRTLQNWQSELLVVRRGGAAR
jgi:hypothetical protein